MSSTTCMTYVIKRNFKRFEQEKNVQMCVPRMYFATLQLYPNMPKKSQDVEFLSITLREPDDFHQKETTEGEEGKSGSDSGQQVFRTSPRNQVRAHSSPSHKFT